MLQHKVEVRGHPAGVSHVRRMTPGANLGCQAWQQVMPCLSQGLVLTFRGNDFSSFVPCALDVFLLWLAVVRGWEVMQSAVLAQHSCCDAAEENISKPWAWALALQGSFSSVRLLAPRFRSVVFISSGVGSGTQGVSASQMLH